MIHWQARFSQTMPPGVVDDVWRRIESKRSRVRSHHVAWRASAVAFVVAIAALLVVLRSGRPAPIALAGGGRLPDAWSADAEPVIVAFDDGSRLHLAPHTIVKVRGGPSDRVGFALETGRATWDIRPRGPRAWVVDAGSIAVRVLGTSFSVGRDGVHVDVSVARGKVRVEGPHMSAELGAGESVSLGGREREHVEGPSLEESAVDGKSNNPPSQPTEAPTRSTSDLPDVPVATPPSTEAARSVPEFAPRPIAPKSPALGEVPTTPEPPPAPGVGEAPSLSGDPPESGPRQSSADPAVVHPSADRTSVVGELMANADDARRVGRVGEATRLLEAAVARQTSGSALAAFTLGKMSLQEMENPGLAARWFEKSITMKLPEGLDEEARARLVEAYRASNQQESAERAAAEYLARYPTGRHTALVKQRGKH